MCLHKGDAVKITTEHSEEKGHTLGALLMPMFKVVKELGGNITAEHGIGSKRTKFLALFMDPVEIELMRAIKKAWDPNWILNPGKIFLGEQKCSS